MELVVKIESVLEKQSFTTKNGDVVERYAFIGVTDGEYPKRVKFDVLGVDKWSRISSYVVVGSMVSVSFDLSSREWNGRWFTQCDAYKVVVVSAGAAPQPSSSAAASVRPAQSPAPNVDNVPF